MNDTVENVKKSPFKPLDIVVFVAIAALIALAFVFFGPKTGDKFEVLINNEKVFEYTFDGGSYLIYDTDKVEVVSNTEFKFFAGGGYNLLTVDGEKKDAYISDADCPTKECKTMRLSSGTVICAPHNLTVRLIGKVSQPTVG